MIKNYLVDSILGERTRLGLSGDITKESLAGRTQESLNDMLADLRATKVPGNLPQAEDPTLKDKGPIQSVEDDLSKKYATVVTRYKFLEQYRGKVAAESYLQSMRAQKMVPANFKVV